MKRAVTCTVWKTSGGSLSVKRPFSRCTIIVSMLTDQIGAYPGIAGSVTSVYCTAGLAGETVSRSDSRRIV